MILIDGRKKDPNEPKLGQNNKKNWKKNQETLKHAL